jgi:hypothetical protein
VSGMKLVSVAVVSVALISACGGGDDKAADTTPASSSSTTAIAATTTVAPDTTAAPTTVPTEVVNADPVLVDLSHFEIKVESTVFKAGVINFKATNSDNVPHEFGIARGNSYAELPQLANGSIDEAALGDDYLGKTPVVDQVLSPTREITFDLPPGNYVMFCNLVVGPVAHAARGQVLSITVIP